MVVWDILAQGKRDLTSVLVSFSVLVWWARDRLTEGSNLGAHIPLSRLLLTIFISGTVGTVTAEEKRTLADDSFARGQSLVEQNCSGCHSIGITGQSPNPIAPPFRQLSERFPIDALQETFITTIDTGHPGMPVFQASQQQIDDILEYIGSVME